MAQVVAIDDTFGDTILTVGIAEDCFDIPKVMEVVSAAAHTY